ncbi:MAG: hypothetical protein HYV27_02650 [Candidatus Hydrogenedentes bacterium]|nr:hypothetical protein [Candidatus Hydrogenedentota bacterium]
MPRLEKFTVKIQTGAQGLGTVPKYKINGFPLEFDTQEGGTGTGETLQVMGEVQSFPHSLTLDGPRDGQAWEIEGMEVTYEVYGQDPFTIRLGGVRLDDESDLNLWYERPAAVLDV